MVENCKYCWQNCPNAGQDGKDETDICENYWGPWEDTVPAEEGDTPICKKASLASRGIYQKAEEGKA